MTDEDLLLSSAVEAIKIQADDSHHSSSSETHVGTTIIHNNLHSEHANAEKFSHYAIDVKEQELVETVP
jgi:hypothetical protein